MPNFCFNVNIVSTGESSVWGTDAQKLPGADPEPQEQ